MILQRPKSSQLKYIALMLSAVLIMSFLYARTQTLDIGKHNQLINNFNQLMRADAILNQHILEIRQGILNYYDLTVNDINTLERLQLEITENLKSQCKQPPCKFIPHIQAFTKVEDKKRELLEAFKSSNAVLLNSLHYLPVATSRLIAHLPAGTRNNDLRRSLNALLRDILSYSLINDKDILRNLDKTSVELKLQFEQRLPELKKEVNTLLSHAYIIYKNKKLTDALVKQMLELPMAQHINELLTTYGAHHSKMLQSTNTYRRILYGFSIFLLLTIGYILVRLNRTASALRLTIADLSYQKFAMDQHAIISIADKHGKITYANDKLCKISKHSYQDLIGKNHRIFKSGFHPPSFYKTLWATVSSGKVWHGQIQNRSKDGNRYWVETTIVPFTDESGKPYQYVAIRTDITAIKAAEEQLHVQAAALDAAASGIIITASDGEILWINKTFTSLTGYTMEDVTGSTPRLLKSDKQDAEFYQALWDTILAGNTWHGEMVNQRKDGSHYTEEQTISPVHDKNGKIIRFIGIKRDITERKKLEAVLRRTQKMEAIGQLSGGIAHDFNNQLGVIIGYLDFLKMHTSHDEKMSKWVSTASRATLRCMDLTRQLLAFSRRQSKAKTVVDINTALIEQKTIIKHSVTPEVEVEYALADDLWLTELDLGEFQDTVLNLVINARDAMPDGGKLLIETGNKILDEDYAKLNPGMTAGNYVRLLLSDNGTGMDKTTLDHVFEPFFTTKKEGKGTGLGMAMVYGFVKRCEGYIKIYSEHGIGTAMQLYLPCSSESTPSLPGISDEQSELPGGNESILIVDDEVDLLQLAEHYLNDLGYHTRTAENATQALKILAEDKTFDLLFSDVVMPGGINGYELAHQAVQQQPELKVLLTSGFTSKTVAKQSADLLSKQLSKQLLSKPYRKTELAKCVRQILTAE